MPLLLLHGALGASKQFDDIVTSLHDHYNVHRLNFIGHGDEPLGEESMSIETLTNQLLSYIDEKFLDPIHIFGYSMGGYVALNAALQNDSKIASIQTLGTKFDWNPQSAAKEVKSLDAEFLMAKAPAFVDHLRVLHGEQWRNLLSNTALLMLALGHHPLLTPSTLPQVKIPIRIMVGDHDQMVNLEESIAAFRALQNGSFAALPGTVHKFEKVNNGLLLTLINQWMNDVKAMQKLAL